MISCKRSIGTALRRGLTTACRGPLTRPLRLVVVRPEHPRCVRELAGSYFRKGSTNKTNKILKRQ